MRKRNAGLVSLALATGLVVGPAALTSSAAPPAADPAAAPSKQGAADRLAGSDEFIHPLEAKRRALKETALTGVLEGRVQVEQRASGKVAKVGKQSAPAGQLTASSRAAGADGAGTGRDQYVELERQGTDQILVVLAEFGNQRHPDYPDRDTYDGTAGPVRFDGPKHNQIPKPGPDDNTTVWQQNYDQAHFEDLYFGAGEESVKSYYERQSSGRYSVEGDVAGWVQVPFNQARYGRSTDLEDTDPVVCASVVCDNAPVLVTDSITALVERRKAQGKTPAQIKEEFAAFDQQDRYDYDGDGEFREPDGYVDHFQVVHAGGDESDGDPTYGEDALWAHRSYVGFNDIGKTGPAFNKLGGTPVGDTGLFIGDYTMQPENGGVSVYVHEYGHDLGLPDHYDTAGGDNGVEFWNLMAQSRLNAAGEPLGTRAGDLSAWDKLQLGWLDYETVRAGQTRTLELGPHEYNSAKAQAVVQVLPDKVVTTDLGAPFAGTKQFFSGNDDDLNTSMTVPVDATGKGTPVLTSKARYAIEEDYDYLYVQTSTDGGQNWTSLPGTVGGEPFGEDGGGNPSIDGTTDGEWVDLRVSLAPLAGKKGLVRFFYRTDGAVSEGGFFADEVTVTAGGTTLFTDGAEGAPKAALDGFTVVGETSTEAFDNYYIASNRSWVSYDKYLKSGPYNFGFPERPDFVEHFSYRPGLLISYWDTSQGDNNTSEHPGEALVTPIDAHPEPLIQLDGEAWRSRVQMFDAAFSLLDAPSFTLHDEDSGQPNNIRGKRAAPKFDDTKSYYRPAITPLKGQVLRKAGVTMEVVKQQGTSMTVKIGVSGK